MKLGGQNNVEKLIPWSKKGEAACEKQYLKEKNVKKNRARWAYLTGMGAGKHRKKIYKIQIARGIQNNKQKTFGLYDLKTGKILMKKDMTAFEASSKNYEMEPMGMHWKNIPY